MAELIIVSQKVLSSIELGENFVTAETLDKLLDSLEITSEELFATNHLKEPPELIKRINQNLATIKNDAEKLEIVLNLTNSLIKI